MTKAATETAPEREKLGLRGGGGAGPPSRVTFRFIVQDRVPGLG